MKNPYFWSAALIQGGTWLPARVIFGLFCGFKIEGREHIQNLGTPLIFAPNHAHEADPTLVRYALPLFSKHAPLFYPVRETQSYKGKNFGWRRHIYGGGFFRAMGALAIRSGLKDYAQSLSLYIEILRNNQSVCMFPEGRLTRDGNLQEAHGGIAFLANETGTPVIPVAIKGTYKLSLKNLLLFRSKVGIRFGAPLRVRFEGEGAPPIEWYKEEATRILSHVAYLLGDEKPVPYQNAQ